MPALTSAHTTTEAAAQKLRREILQALKDKKLKAGDRVLSERKLAERLGVSYMTARKALSTLVGDGLLERRPRQGVFVGPGAHRNGSRKLKRVRGLFYLEALTSFYGRMASALTRSLADAGVEIAWSTAAEFVRPDLRERLGQWDEDAFVVVGQMPPALLEALRRTGKPLTFVDQTSEGYSADHAVLDNEGVGFAAAERFFAAGRKRVAYAGGEINPGHPYHDPAGRSEWPNSVMRGMGVRRAYITRGMPLDESLLFTIPGAKHIKACAERWFGGGASAPRSAAPDAIVCFDIQAAAILLQEAQARGVRVPEDLGIVALGDLPEWIESRPALTHYTVDWETLGREAARLCLLRQEEPEAPPRRVVVPWTCNLGGSAGWTESTEPSNV
jgi:LacI family transcriptional regulator